VQQFTGKVLDQILKWRCYHNCSSELFLGRILKCNCGYVKACNFMLFPFVPQVDDDSLDEIKPNIKAESESKEVNVSAPFIIESAESVKSVLLESKKIVKVKPVPKISVQRRLLLECPLCGMPFRSCKNRYKSLVSHIKRRHNDCQRKLMRIVHKKYFEDF